MMKSRERILKTLNHEEPDRIPRDLGGTESSSLSAFSFIKVKNFLGFDDIPFIYDPYQYIAYTNDAIRKRYLIDTNNLSPGPKNWNVVDHPLGFKVKLPEKWKEVYNSDGSTSILNKNGNIIAKRPLNGYYFEPVNPPLSAIDGLQCINSYKETIYSYDWPFFIDESLDELKQRAVAMYGTGQFIVFNLCCHILAAGQMLRGYENFMVDMLCNETMVHKILELLLEGYLMRIKTLAPLLRNHIDMVLLNDDLGTQNGPMLSLDLYKKMIKPYQQKLFFEVKKEFGKPILFHSCGAIKEFIPDLIEIGVDAINPIQLSAAGMDIKELKRSFGKFITFWGGGVDTQSILNHGTPHDVMESIKINIDILAPGGGFVFCQVHNIQPDVPIENINAMYEALDRFGNY
ncbi:MAG: hypothetical protein HPY74_19170 [Firmicutes bacterium]|nr:hypothetical protein [Bacillota bacterium]